MDGDFFVLDENRFKIGLRNPDGSAAVFDRKTGSTHLLSSVAVPVICFIGQQKRPVAVQEIEQAMEASDLKIESSEVKKLLNGLEESGLIEVV